MTEIGEFRSWHSFSIRQRSIDVCYLGYIDRRRGRGHVVVRLTIEYMA
jgi:hypothetical protein